MTLESLAPKKPVGFSPLFKNRRFTCDDTLAFTGIVHTVLPQCESIVDVGCGRGSYADVDPGSNLFDLRGPGRRVIGMDIDPKAAANPFIDEFVHLAQADKWPLENQSVDLVVADWTLEHIRAPREFALELARVLRVGGAFVARSVNRGSILGRLSRAVPNRWHAAILRRAQPDRDSSDVFPAYYRLNTTRALASAFHGAFEYSIAYRPALENYVYPTHPRLASVVASLERLQRPNRQTVFIVSARKLA